MISSGLVSVTFRHLSCERVIALAAMASLKAIEWGGDVHVPAGKIQLANEVRKHCNDSGIKISAYGSYYRVGTSAVDEFKSILESAEALQTKTIRVWAGTLPSAASSPAQREHIGADLIRCCDLAAGSGIDIATEYHSGTLTDSADTCLELIKWVNRKNCRTYWQPPIGIGKTEAMDGLQTVMPYLSNLHVFHWWPDHHHRLPLIDGYDTWLTYLVQANADDQPRFASLEFVRGDSEQQLLSDARTLNDLLQALPT